MGLLDQILGGFAGNDSEHSPMGQASGGRTSGVLAALLPVVLSMLSNRQGAGMGGSAAASAGMGGGGLGALLEQLTRTGYGQQANSWVGTGPNEPLPAQAWSDVLGSQRVAEIAAQAGVSEDEARTGLSELMPEVVDRLTPQGRMPVQDQLLASLDDYARRLRS